MSTFAPLSRFNMPRSKSFRQLGAIISLTLALAACGGGGGGGGGDSPAPINSGGGGGNTTPPPTGSDPTQPTNPSPTDPTTPPTQTPPSNTTPANPAVAKSAKRGIAYDLANSSDLDALSPGVSWWYNWTLKPANGVPTDYRVQYDADYIPFLWNNVFNDAEVEAFLRANPSIKYLLLLNEPNLTDQANHTPQQAAQLWPRYEAIANRTGVQLVGPAITWGTMQNFADPVVWMDAFYDAYRAANGGRDPRIDYLAFHWYDYGLNEQLNRLTKYGKPFWVTEFANWHSNNDGAQIDSVAKQKVQMTEMVAVCESRSDVFRYAWFTGRWADEATRHTSLLAGTGELSELGRHYMQQPYWLGTWSSAPQRQSVTFNQQTLRQIVRTSTAGTVARVRLSNAFGTQPITVSNVRIARRNSEASIDASTDRALTFGGQASVTLPAGSEIYSDKVTFNAPAASDVAISFYLPNATTVTTGQTTAVSGSYVASGNVSANAAFTGSSQSQGYYLLTGLDVQGTATRGSVVAFGASITGGVNADRNWPSLLAERLNAANINVGVLNQAIGGNGSLSDDSGPSAENRFQRDVLAQTDVRWVVYSDDPINDLRRSPQPTYAQLIAPLQRMIVRAHDRQVKFLCSTLTPYQGDTRWTASQETIRQQYNTFVRGTDSGCDAVIDQDAATRDPSSPGRFLPMYDSGDHLHPNAAGQQAIANSFDLGVFLSQ